MFFPDQPEASVSTTRIKLSSEQIINSHLINNDSRYLFLPLFICLSRPYVVVNYHSKVKLYTAKPTKRCSINREQSG